jgi:hypothetical protein
LPKRAQARFQLDTGQDIDPGDLALLGDISERRIRNMMAGKERVFSTKDGKIPATEALSWLKNRADKFRPSCWRDQNTFEDLAEQTVEVEDALFVPVASDNSIFHPGLVRNGTFTVGHGKREKKCNSYEIALASLQKLANPSWSRPTSTNGGSQVSVYLGKKRIEDLSPRDPVRNRKWLMPEAVRMSRSVADWKASHLRAA